MTLLGPYVVACGLLVVAGIAKARDPHDTAVALGRTVGLPSRPMSAVVRVVAVAEAALGALAIATPTATLAASVALSYGAFASFVAWVRLRHGALASCGCFGTPDTPATAGHAVVDLLLAASAGAVAAGSQGMSLGAVLAAQPGHGVPLLFVSAAGLWCALLVLVRWPRLVASRQLYLELP